jgi:hypothetical protein
VELGNEASGITLVHRYVSKSAASFHAHVVLILYVSFVRTLPLRMPVTPCLA